MADAPPSTRSSSTQSDGYDLVLLAGQSNMSGRGTEHHPGHPDAAWPGVMQFGNSGRSAGRITPATAPLSMHGQPSGIGPGIGFGRRLLDRHALPGRVGRAVLLVPVAHGGTGLVPTADGGLCWAVGHRPLSESLYANAVHQGRAAFRAAERAAGHARWVAMLWVQGETDGDRDVTGEAYAAHLDALIVGLRTEFQGEGGRPVPWVIGGMVPDFLGRGTRRQIDIAQRGTLDRLPAVGYAAGPPDQHQHDGNHYTSAGASALAGAMFDAFLAISPG